MRASGHIARHFFAAFVALAALALTTGCPPNEAKVCSTRSENAGATCAATYDLCKGGTQRIECGTSGTGVSCACVENGIKKNTFASADACNVTPDTLKKRAAEGCGWDLDEGAK